MREISPEMVLAQVDRLLREESPGAELVSFQGEGVYGAGQ